MHLGKRLPSNFIVAPRKEDGESQTGGIMPVSPIAPATDAEGWGKSLIVLLWVLCIVFFLLSCYKFMKSYCIALYGDPLLFFRPSGLQRLLRGHDMEEQLSAQLQSRGLASAIIHSLPTTQFSNRSQCGGDCAVCLGEYREGEWLRLLPSCCHVFHVACIDTWLRCHSNCPLCRTCVLRDFAIPASAPTGTILQALEREDVNREMHSISLEGLAVPHMRLQDAGTSSDPEEAFSSPVTRLQTPDDIETPFKLAHNLNGECSSRSLGSDGHTAKVSGGLGEAQSYTE